MVQLGSGPPPRLTASSTLPLSSLLFSLPGTPEMTIRLVSLSKNSSLTKFGKLYAAESFLSLKPMFLMNSMLRKPRARPLVKCVCTSMMKYSPLGHFSSLASGSSVSAADTSQYGPYTILLARKAVAMAMELAMKVRRSMPSFFALSSAKTPMRYSTSFCLLFCGRGMNSSLETTCVGTDESTPFLRSRCHLGIHIGKLLEKELLRLDRSCFSQQPVLSETSPPL